MAHRDQANMVARRNIRLRWSVHQTERRAGRAQALWRHETLGDDAGSSLAGRAFSARSCDVLFRPLRSLEAGIDEVKQTEAEARAHGRDIGVYGNGYVVCRKTRKEAEEYHRYYAEEMGDWDAVDHLIASLSTTTTSGGGGGGGGVGFGVGGLGCCVLFGGVFFFFGFVCCWLFFFFFFGVVGGLFLCVFCLGCFFGG